jgi:hypothetical protein
MAINNVGIKGIHQVNVLLFYQSDIINECCEEERAD